MRHGMPTKNTPKKILDLSYKGRTPVFTLPSYSSDQGRALGAEFNKTTLDWIYPAYFPFGQMVLDDLKIIDDTVTLTDSAEAQRRSLFNTNSLFRCGKLPPSSPFSFIVRPYRHQLDSLIFAYHNPKAALFLEPGLGKTGVVINLLRLIKALKEDDTTALIIVPKVILYKWQEEVSFHSGGDLTSVVIDGTLKEKRAQLQKEANVYIMSYGSAAGKKAYGKGEECTWNPTFAEYVYKTLNYGVIAVDESQNLLSPSSFKTKACLYLSRKAHRRIIMTGTGSLGNPLHLWGQLKFLTPSLIENAWHFRNKFTVFADSKRRIVTGFKNLDTLQTRVSRCAIIYKAEDCLDLPKLNIIDMTYKLGPKQKKDYNELVTASAVELSSRLKVVDSISAATRITKLLQICSGFLYQSNKDLAICDVCQYLPKCVRDKIKPYTRRCEVVKKPPLSTVIRYPQNPKLDLCTELLNSILNTPRNKLIIWAHFKEEMNAIAGRLEELAVKFVRVDGSTSSKLLQDRVRSFETDNDVRCYLGQLSSGVGIDLVSANYTIYYSLDFDLGHYEQSLRRNHRIGQTLPVTVYRLIADGTLERYIAMALSNKKNIASALTSNVHCIMCKEQFNCFEHGVLPFTPGCIYESQQERVVTRPSIIT